MTPREARRQRRAAERKLRKAEIRRTKADLVADPELRIRRLEAAPNPSEASPAENENAQSEQTLLDWLAEARRRHYPNGLPKHAPQPLELTSQNDRTKPDIAQANRHAINRANAQFSTGPRTAAGKCSSSRNSTKHGLASGVLLIPGENAADFDALLADLLDDHQPANRTETLLINQMAQSYWLEQRALRLQNDCFTSIGVDQKGLALYLRYAITHQRAFHKALADLQRLQKERKKASLGFVSQQASAVARANGFVSQAVVNSTPPTGFVRQNEAPNYARTGFVSQSAPSASDESSLTSSEAA